MTEPIFFDLPDGVDTELVSLRAEVRELRALNKSNVKLYQKLFDVLTETYVLEYDD